MITKKDDLKPVPSALAGLDEQGLVHKGVHNSEKVEDKIQPC